MATTQQQNEDGFAALPPEIMFMILDILVEEEKIPDPALSKDALRTRNALRLPSYPDDSVQNSLTGPSDALPGAHVPTPAAPWQWFGCDHGMGGPFGMDALSLPPLDSCPPPSPEQRPKPVAFPPSAQLTQTLVSLSLVCRSVYPYALRYLYTHCLYIDNANEFAVLRRALARHAQQGWENGKKSVGEELWRQADVLQYVQGVYISFGTTKREYDVMGKIGGFAGLGNVLNCLGTSLKRLVIDLENVSMVTDTRLHSQSQSSQSSQSPQSPQSPQQQQHRHVLSLMPCLQDLTISYTALQSFSTPPPNLKRLCIPTPNLFCSALAFSAAIASLETLVILRPPNLTAANIESWLDAFTTQRSLDIILVDRTMHHMALPPKCRARDDENDIVKIWEVDATPTRLASNEQHWVLSANWCCARANDGSLWSVEKWPLGDRERRRADALAHGGGPSWTCGVNWGRDQMCSYPGPHWMCGVDWGRIQMCSSPGPSFMGWEEGEGDGLV